MEFDKINLSKIIKHQECMKKVSIIILLLSLFCIGCKKKTHCPEFPVNLDYFPYYIGQELEFMNLQQDIRSFVVTDKKTSNAKVFDKGSPDCSCFPSSSFSTNQNQNLLKIVQARTSINIPIEDEKIVISAMMYFDFDFVMTNNYPFHESVGVNLLSKLKKPILFTDVETYLPDTALLENENNMSITKMVIVKGKGLISYTTADGEEWKLVE